MGEAREHAVVIGGSMAGLLAARVLSDHFTRVTLVERDDFPDTPSYRPGTAQSRHLHVLWSRGLEIVEQLFPGLEEELQTAGAPTVNVSADVLWLTSPGWRRRFDVTRLLTFSRELLDWTVRSRLAGIDGLRILSGHEATELLPESAGNGVAGVVIRPRGSMESSEQLPADLVVDATGRRSRAPEWLEQLGYPAVPETRVDPLLGYSSRCYAIPPGFDPGWKALYLQTKPPGSTRAGLLFPQEGNRWIVSLYGMGGDAPPTNDKGFLEFAASLRSPELYEAIREAEPVTPITGFRRTANHRRHYERMSRWPDRFVAVGDSVCAFNPIYGQGMSAAAINAMTLDACLRADSRTDGFGRRFQRKVARNASGPWLIATGEDLRFKTTQGASAGLRTRIINAYVDRVVALANVNRHVCGRLIDVLSLTAQPWSLFRPDVLWRAATLRARQPTGPDDLAVRPKAPAEAPG